MTTICTLESCRDPMSIVPFIHGADGYAYDDEMFANDCLEAKAFIEVQPPVQEMDWSDTIHSFSLEHAVYTGNTCHWLVTPSNTLLTLL